MAAAADRPARLRHRPQFHKLRVARVDRLTDDAVAVAFAVPPELHDEFTFQPGQHVTLRRTTDGEEARRSYSICSAPSELDRHGLVRVGIRAISGGTFSKYVNDELAAGDVMEVMPPLGGFTTDLDPGRAWHYAAVVAGSGITPVLSLVAGALEAEPASRFTVLYGNRYTRSVMFADELADLKDRWPGRLQVVHVLSQEPQDAELLSGRIDPPRLGRLLDTLVPVSTVDEWFLCGPFGMVVAARELLTERGVPADRVHVELFFAGDIPEVAARPAGDGVGADQAEVTIRLDGRESTFGMRRDERVLDQALTVRAELPYACKGGVCATCRAKLLDGEVRMARNYALSDADLAAGYVLTCQSSPVTDTVVLDYDA